jgi:hypothetical protein
MPRHTTRFAGVGSPNGTGLAAVPPMSLLARVGKGASINFVEGIGRHYLPMDGAVLLAGGVVTQSARKPPRRKRELNLRRKQTILS